MCIGADIPKSVSDFLLEVRNAGRDAFFIPTVCVENDNTRATEVNEVLKCVDTAGSYTTTFQINHTQKDKYLKSNLYPITIPKETFVLDIGFKTDGRPWKLLTKVS